MGRSQVRYNQARRGRGGRMGPPRDRRAPAVAPPPQPRASTPDGMTADDAQVVLNQMSHVHKNILKKERGFLSRSEDASLIDPKLLESAVDRLKPHQLWRIGKDVADTFARRSSNAEMSPDDLPTREFTTQRGEIPNAVSSLSEGTAKDAPYEADPVPQSVEESADERKSDDMDSWLDQALQSNDDADLAWLDQAIL